MSRSTIAKDLRPSRRSGCGSAFTLIELLASLAIISILVTLSAHTFRRVSESSVLAQALGHRTAVADDHDAQRF